MYFDGKRSQNLLESLVLQGKSRGSNKAQN